MITDDQVVSLFAKSNPVPSLDLLDPIEPVTPGRLEDRSERSREMSELQRIEPELNGQSRKQPVFGWVAAGVMTVAALAGIIALIDQDTDVVAAPVEIAESFMKARNAHDADAMSLVLSDDAVFVTGDELVMNEDNISSAAEFERINGWTYEDQSCVEYSPSKVRCDYTLENDLGRALGRAPESDTFVIFEVEGGKIATVQNLGGSAYIGPGMSAFMSWWAVNHPEDVPGGDVLSLQGATFEPEFLELWEQRIDEFVAEHEG